MSRLSATAHRVREMTYRSRINLGVAVVVIAIGTIFAVEGWRIDPASYEAIGPRFVPMFLAVLMIALGAVIGLAAFLGQDGELPADQDFGFRNSDIGRVVAVVAVGALYVVAFWALGYLAGTVLAAGMAFWVFGVRSPKVIVFGAIVAGVVYQFVFMGLMGLLDPRGEVLDLRSLSRVVTPGG